MRVLCGVLLVLAYTGAALAADNSAVTSPSALRTARTAAELRAAMWVQRGERSSGSVPGANQKLEVDNPDNVAPQIDARPPLADSENATSPGLFHRIFNRAARVVSKMGIGP